MKARPTGGVLALLTAGLVIHLLLTACQPAAPPSGASDDPGSAGTDVSLQPGSLDAWVAGVSNTQGSDDPAGDAPTYASDLVHEQFRDGLISQDEFFLQSARAAFQPELLDEAFQAEQDPGIDATALLRLLRQQWDFLSPAAQNELQSYLLSCDDPASFWHDSDQTTAVKAISAAKVIAMDNPRSDGAYWLITGPAGTEDQQNLVREALDYSYERFANLGFAEPTDWIRVSLRERLSSADYYGEEYMATLDGAWRCHILLRSTLEDDVLTSTTAHELFHCFQDYVTADVAVGSAPWVWESSAVWSEEFVYPDLNREHEYDSQFFESLNSYFFDVSGTLEYARYMYWFFIDQRAGKTGEAARDLYFQIHTDGAMEAITSRPNFYTEYKDYALWNLNMTPYKFYEDFGDEPSGRPSGFSFARAEIAQGEAYYENVWLAEGGIAYYLYTFDDIADRVHFDMHEIKKTDGNEVGVQIVYRIDGAWTYEDVSARDEFTFCRSRPSEDLDAIIFIVSNSNLDMDDPDAQFNGELVIDATEWCAPTWHGRIECTFNWAGDSFDPSAHGCEGAYRNAGTRRLEQNLVQDRDRGRFYIADYTVSQYSHYYWSCTPRRSEFADLVGYIAWEREEYDIALSRTEVLDIPDTCPPNCFDVGYNIERVEGGDGRTYTLHPHRIDHVGDYTSTYTALDVPGSLGLMQGHAPEVYTDIDYHTLTVTIPPEPIELHMSDDDESMLTGSYVDENWTCHAEFLYE